MFLHWGNKECYFYRVDSSTFKVDLMACLCQLLDIILNSLRFYFPLGEFEHTFREA